MRGMSAIPLTDEHSDALMSQVMPTSDCRTGYRQCWSWVTAALPITHVFVRVPHCTSCLCPGKSRALREDMWSCSSITRRPPANRPLGLRALCGRRVPAGYFFSIIPNTPAKTPAVPGGRNVRARPISAGRAIAAARQARSVSLAANGANAVGSAASLLRSVRAAGSMSVEGPLLGDPTEASSAAIGDGITGGSSFISQQQQQRPSSAGPRRNVRIGSFSTAAAVGPQGSFISQRGALLGGSSSAFQIPGTPSPTQGSWGRRALASAASREASAVTAATGSLSIVGLDGLVSLTANKARWVTYDVPFNHPLNSTRAAELGAEEARASGRNVRSFSDAAAVIKVRP
jgi:hypothetical protein